MNKLIVISITAVCLSILLSSYMISCKLDKVSTWQRQKAYMSGCAILVEPIELSSESLEKVKALVSSYR